MLAMMAEYTRLQHAERISGRNPLPCSRVQSRVPAPMQVDAGADRRCSFTILLITNGGGAGFKSAAELTQRKRHKHGPVRSVV